VPSETSVKPRRPIPVPSELTQPFWDAARRHELSLQHCVDCGAVYHPPVPQCLACASTNLEWKPVRGEGVIHSATVMHLPRVAGFEESVPYACLIVELKDHPGTMLVSNLLDADPHEARIGADVEVVFEDIDEGFVLPQFRLAAPASKE
jgi:uncharacterized OB-fold protein